MPATGAALTLAMISPAIAFFGSTSIGLILLSFLTLDVAIQAVNVLNQPRLFSVEPSARSRLNTAFVTCNSSAALPDPYSLVACGKQVVGAI